MSDTVVAAGELPPAAPSAGRVLVVDDDQDGATLLAMGLGRRGYTVTAAGDAEQACALAVQGFDIAVVDIVLPGRDGLSLIPDLARLCPEAILVVMTGHADKDIAVRALNLGVQHFLEKPCAASIVAGALDRLMARRPTTAPGNRLANALARLPLNPRERLIVTLVLRGQGNRQIADQCGVTEQAVKNATSRIYAKLGVTGRGELFHLVFPI
jgi:DNA-binding NarL/FixJ family response regulator